MIDQSGVQYTERKVIPLPMRSRSRPSPICFVTLSVRDGNPIFSDPSLAEMAVDLLRRHAEKRGVAVYAYCVMPDHMHLVVGPSAICGAMTFVGEYRDLSQRAAWRRGVEGKFWQERALDHFLRPDEPVEAVVQHVLDSPVRLRLAEEPKNYPFSGSLAFGL